MDNNSFPSVLPERSVKLYERQYDQFMAWCTSQNMSSTVTENVLIQYFVEMAKTLKSSTLWSTFSMLKSTILTRHDIDISKFSKLMTFIKKQHAGYKAKKSRIFTREDVTKFLKEAPDSKYLMWKVCLLLGIYGACRIEELKNITVDDIEIKENLLIIKIPEAKAGKTRIFTVNNEMDDINPIEIFNKYYALRPKNIAAHNRLFVFYGAGKCSSQPVGIHTFGKIPHLIASYLNLPHPKEYIGSTFRRTSAAFLEDTGSDILTLESRKIWERATVARGKRQNELKQQNEATTSSIKVEPIDLDGPSCSTKMELPEVKVEDLSIEPTEVMINYEGGGEPSEDPLDIKDLATPTTHLHPLPSTSILTGPSMPKPIAPKTKSVILKKIVDPKQIQLLKEQFKQTTRTMQNQLENPYHDRSTDSPTINENEDADNFQSEDVKDMLDISDTHLMLDPECPSSRDCDLFGEYISQQLKKLPVGVARQLQADIQALVLKSRLEHLQETQMDVPSIIKIESCENDPLADTTPSEVNLESSTSTTTVVTESIPTKIPQTSARKRTTESDRPTTSPSAKRLKSSTPRTQPNSELQSTNTKENDVQKDRSDYNIFAEHIAEQMKTLPEETAIRLQLDFYELLKKVDSVCGVSQVRIKTETVDEISSGIDCQ